MSAEQIAMLIATLIGAPFLVEIVKRWFDSLNLNLASKSKTQDSKDTREWEAMEKAMARERQMYAELLLFERNQFAARLSDIETRLGKIQEEAQSYQKLYWEERVVRERLQARIETLESEMSTRSYK